jgi:hypothetical protein
MLISIHSGLPAGSHVVLLGMNCTVQTKSWARRFQQQIDNSFLEQHKRGWLRKESKKRWQLILIILLVLCGRFWVDVQYGVLVIFSSNCVLYVTSSILTFCWLMLLCLLLISAFFSSLSKVSSNLKTGVLADHLALSLAVLALFWNIRIKIKQYHGSNKRIIV